jgi:hypothetical protein
MSSTMAWRTAGKLGSASTLATGSARVAGGEIGADAWKAVHGRLSSRNGLLERRICSERDRRVECSLDCLRMIRASE